MSISVTARWWLPFVLLVVLATAGSGQYLREAEVKAHGRDAITDFVRRSGVDPATALRVQREFEKALPSGLPVDESRTQVSLARALRAKKFGLASENSGLRLLNKPEKNYDNQEIDRMAGQLTRSLFSDIRQRSIVAEIGSGESKTFGRTQLVPYLRDTLRVPDYQNVADSFAGFQDVKVITLDQDTELLRLYGGESKPIGRYFFCCTWSLTTPGETIRWSDASGLATPASWPGGCKDSEGNAGDRWRSGGQLCRSVRIAKTRREHTDLCPGGEDVVVRELRANRWQEGAKRNRCGVG